MHGEVEFLGRVDNQIKLRGYRIDPEEIEQQLCRHPAASEAVVFLDKGADDAPEALFERLSALDPECADALLREVERTSIERSKTYDQSDQQATL